MSDGVDAHDRVAGYANLATCGSVWSCTVCAAKIAVRRAADLKVVEDWAEDQGHSIGMITLTARHEKGQSLAELWDAITGAWASVTSGRSWVGESEVDFAVRLANWEAAGAAYDAWTPAQGTRRPRAPRGHHTGTRPVRSIGIVERWGVLGFARVIEITHGDQHGWHPHLHVMVVLEGEQDHACFEKLGDAMWPRWLRALEARGLTALRHPGLNVRTRQTHIEGGGLAQYFTKSLSIEMTHGFGKVGKELGNRVPFQILGSVIETLKESPGLVDHDYDLWEEWQLASHGRRQLTWSRGLRDMANLAAEQSDDEIVQEQLDDGERVLFMASDTWHAVVDMKSEPHLLTLAEDHGLEAVGRWLDLHQLDDWWIGLWAKDGAVPLPATPEPPSTP